MVMLPQMPPQMPRQQQQLLLLVPREPKMLLKGSTLDGSNRVNYLLVLCTTSVSNVLLDKSMFRYIGIGIMDMREPSGRLCNSLG